MIIIINDFINFLIRNYNIEFKKDPNNYYICTSTINEININGMSSKSFLDAFKVYYYNLSNKAHIINNNKLKNYLKEHSETVIFENLENYLGLYGILSRIVDNNIILKVRNNNNKVFFEFFVNLKTNNHIRFDFKIDKNVKDLEKELIFKFNDEIYSVIKKIVDDEDIGTFYESYKVKYIKENY